MWRSAFALVLLAALPSFAGDSEYIPGLIGHSIIAPLCGDVYNPGDSGIDYAIARRDSAGYASTSGRVTSDLPRNTVMLTPLLWINNGAGAAGGAELDVRKYAWRRRR
ncbi:MAG: hypothetical protein ACREJ6_00010 [Candidatus Methylomirabilis sp.]